MDYQLIMGTNAGVFQDCYATVQTDSKGMSCDAVCDRIYEDIKCSRRTGPDGLVGYVKLRAGAKVTLSAGSTQQVIGVIRNKFGKNVTGLLDSSIPNRLPTGVVVSCSLCNVSRGFGKVKVCLINQTETDIPLSRRCIIAGAYLTSWISDNSETIDDGSHSSTARVAKYEATPSAVRPGLPKVNNTSITEEEFRSLPFDWGPIDAKEKERILKIAFQRSQVFSRHEWDIGLTSEAYHEIRLTKDEPFRERSRRVSPRDLKDLRDHLQSLMDIRSDHRVQK